MGFYLGSRPYGNETPSRVGNTKVGEKKRPSYREELDLFGQYRGNPSPQLRNLLVERHLYIPNGLASKVHAKLPKFVDVGDLTEAGVIGLIEAIDSFDVSRGVRFEIYSYPGVKGAIFDELRGLDWAPRLVRTRSKSAEKGTDGFFKEKGYNPTAEELAEFLELEDRELRVAGDVAGEYCAPRQLVSLTVCDGNGETRIRDGLRDLNAVSPLDETRREILKEELIRGLGRDERLIIILYYYEGMTMGEIGKTIGLSESRVSQVHSSILRRLRSRTSLSSRLIDVIEG